MQLPFDVPEEILLDPETGYALNIPVVYQDPPFWWEREPEKYAKLNMAREAAGVVIEDFPNGPVFLDDVQTIPMGQRYKRKQQ